MLMPYQNGSYLELTCYQDRLHVIAAQTPWPLAFIVDIHFWDDMVKELKPALDKGVDFNPSNPYELGKFLRFIPHLSRRSPSLLPIRSTAKYYVRKEA